MNQQDTKCPLRCDILSNVKKNPATISAGGVKLRRRLGRFARRGAGFLLNKALFLTWVGGA